MKYNLLKTLTKDKWARIGTHKRSGVVVPLFSINSNQSMGIGEIPDIKYIVDWCKMTGMSIIQLLPLNELGSDHAPYNAISTFALEPMYLRLNDLIGVDVNEVNRETKILKEKFSGKRSRVDYGIKTEKLKVLQKIFNNSFAEENYDFKRFVEWNKYWLKDYALFKIISESPGNPMWDKWNRKLSIHEDQELEKVFSENTDKVKFLYWIQWQLYEQVREVKKYANDKGVMIMGDLPFLVSRYSADVWSHQHYFKLNLFAGAPPDMYFAYGQLWGMPPYNWEKIEKDQYIYLKQRLQYSENFYDLFRIDHFIGLFRIWTVELKDSGNSALYGKFDPENKELWEEHGKKIIDKMIRFTNMLPCAEDLGTVPKCSFKTLAECGIPGVDFQRFLKNENNDFIKPHEYRINSSAVISTHDSPFFFNWWDFEAGTVDGKLFDTLCRSSGIKRKKLKLVKGKLFDKRRSKYNRLFWKENINRVEILLRILGLRSKDSRGITSLYKSTYNEKNKFIKYLEGRTQRKILQASPSLVKKCLERVNESGSLFSIQLIQEYLSLDKKLLERMNKRSYRINSPGTFSNKNWSIRLPIGVEKLSGLRINKLIREINSRSRRIVD